MAAFKMTTIKLMFPVFLIIIVCSLVNSEERENSNSSNASKSRYSRYKYNHPPYLENYENIPVAIVYDEVVDRASRKPTTPPAVTSETKTIDEKQSQDKEVPKINVEKIEATTVIVPIIKVPKSRKIELETRIPVSVVYDEDPKVVRNNRIRAGVLTRVRKLKKGLVQSSTELPKTEETPEAASTSDNTLVLTTRTHPEPIVIATEPSIITSSENVLRNADIVTNRGHKSNTGEPEIDRSESRKRLRERTFVPIIESENRVFSHSGTFTYSYEGGDGTKAFSRGELKSVDKDNAGEAVVGGFSYKGKDGNDYSLTYTADENGYRPVGAHLPTPPPIPPYILRALKHLATKTTPEPVTESFQPKNVKNK